MEDANRKAEKDSAETEGENNLEDGHEKDAEDAASD